MDNRDFLLPLNCIDTGFLALICVNERPQFHWLVKIDGEIDSTSLNQTLLSVFKVHPNLSAKMCTRRMKPFRKMADAAESTMLTYLDLSGEKAASVDTDQQYEEALTEWLNRTFDPFHEFPVRAMLIKKAPSESDLVFSFDHSSLDGIRSLRFMEEVVKAYNGGAHPGVSSLSDLRRSRGDELLGFARSRRATGKNFYSRVFTSLFHRFFIRPLNPPCRVSHDKSERRSATAYLTGSVNQSELDEIRSRAKASGFTMNDVLLAACFRVIDKWNGLHHKSAGKATIMVPVNLGPESFREVLTNQLSFVSMSTRPGERSDPRALLRKIRKDMHSMVASGVPFSIIYFLHFSSYVPFILIKAFARLLMAVPVQVDTILLSNLGIIWPEAAGEAKMGGSTIKDITFMVPVITPMGLGIGVHTNHGSLHICLGYKTGLFSNGKAQEFLDMFLEEVRYCPNEIKSAGKARRGA
jgi:NRPS condensation-like uncharacterized protein